MTTTNVDHVTPALLDQLADARCALRDHVASYRPDLLKYAQDCIDKAHKLATMLATDGATYRQVADVLNGR